MKPTSNALQATSFLLLSILLIINQPLIAYADDTEIQSGNAISLNAYNNEVLFEKNAYDQAFPASTTKVLTAILLMEELDDDSIIEVSEEASKADPSNDQLLLEPGDEISKRDALHMIMMISANDASNAIAEAVSGSVEDFSNKMNERAKEIGTKDSYFKNPSGLPDPSHVTTAYDMALITKEAKKYPEIFKAAKESEYTVNTGDREVTIKKTHTIFEENNYAIGGKTGWTHESGYTLTMYSENEGTEIITVVLNANGRSETYDDSLNLLEKAFGDIETRTLFDKGEIIIKKGKGDRSFSLYTKEDIQISIDKTKELEISTELKDLTLFDKGDEVASLKVKSDGEKEVEFPLYTDKKISLDEPMELDKDAVEELLLMIINKNSLKLSGTIVLLPSLLVALFTLFFSRR